MTVCYDTGFVIDYLAGRPGAVAVEESLEGPVVLSTITVYELLYGAARPRTRSQVEALVRDHIVAPVDFAVATMAAEIQRDPNGRGARLPVLDALIAATAILAGATLVTRDRHFDRVPGKFGLALRRYSIS